MATRHLRLITDAIPVVAGAILIVAFMIALLVAESEMAVIGLLAAGMAAVLVGNWTGLLRRAGRSFAQSENVGGAVVVLAALALVGYFYDDHFTLLLLATVMLYVLATLGLSLQFGYAGILNFAGASFFGIGGYTAAVLNSHSAIPHVVAILFGGLIAALVGSMLLLPVLRTRGHYAAVVTIAFALLFKTFLEVNDVLGGPQGMQVPPMELLGWSFNDSIAPTESIEVSFYVNYIAVILAILITAFVLVRRLERSWIGLNLDALRLDETAARCFGLNVVRWKITAFLLGNFLIGIAGAIYAMVVGFVAPTSFTFADSLIFVSIVLLGGIGNVWGLILATAIVVIIPEKLQAIQEYRFLLYASLVILMLLFRPEGLLPRPVRVFFPRWRAKGPAHKLIPTVRR